MAADPMKPAGTILSLMYSPHCLLASQVPFIAMRRNQRLTPSYMSLGGMTAMTPVL